MTGRRMLAAVLVTVGCAGGASAQGAQVGDAETGADLYFTYCAACHGSDAEGTGPTAELMTIQPTDLTRLAAENGGSFPLARVAGRIDGRDPVLAHGGPMPIFGPFFEGEDVALKTDAGQPMLTLRPVADLVAWLRTIQEGAPRE